MGVIKRRKESKVSYNCIKCGNCGLHNFKYYPFCQNCDKISAKMGILELKKLKTENKLPGDFCSRNGEICKIISDFRDMRKFKFKEISDWLNSAGYKTDSGANWTPPLVGWVYKQYLAIKKREKK